VPCTGKEDSPIMVPEEVKRSTALFIKNWVPVKNTRVEEGQVQASNGLCWEGAVLQCKDEGWAPGGVWTPRDRQTK